jgi:glycosyltransferase involved in cell wall biosynthesis
MKSSLRILFLARWYPDRYDPMPGLFIQRHAEVVAEFADVAVLYLRAAPNQPLGFEIVQTNENKVVTVKVYYGTRSILPAIISKPFNGLLFAIAFFKAYIYLLSKWNKPDIIHVNVLTRLGLFALWLRCFKGINYVITEHWSRYLPVTGTYKGFFRKVFTKIVVRNASAVSTVSENLANAMKSHGLLNDNYIVLPNVVDTDEYIIDLEKLDSSKKRFIHISCFEDRSKNISGILRTIGKLAKTRNDFECFMVGEGIDLEKLKIYAAELGLPETTFKFAGLLENSDVVEAYQSSEFMVMFSNYENMPVVISEAFACGLPVIATSVGGIPEYINHENGRVVKPKDEKELLEAFTFMLDHSSEFNRNKIRQQAIDIFGKQAVTSKLQQLYEFVKQ